MVTAGQDFDLGEVERPKAARRIDAGRWFAPLNSPVRLRQPVGCVSELPRGMGEPGERLLEPSPMRQGACLSMLPGNRRGGDMTRRTTTRELLMTVMGEVVRPLASRLPGSQAAASKFGDGRRPRRVAHASPARATSRMGPRLVVDCRVRPEAEVRWLAPATHRTQLALSFELLAQLIEASRRSTPDAVRAIVITGAGATALRRPQRVFGRGFDAGELRAPLLRGFALGGGCELAMACQMTIAARTRSSASPIRISGWPNCASSAGE